MISLDAYFVYLLLISNAVLLAIACYSIVRFERRCRQAESFWASPTGSALAAADDNGAQLQLKTTQHLEQRVGELQRTVKVMQTRAPNQPLSTASNLPIENAVRMARLGATISDLTKSCGLNIGEAQLLQKLHGKAPRVAAGV